MGSMGKYGIKNVGMVCRGIYRWRRKKSLGELSISILLPRRMNEETERQRSY